MVPAAKEILFSTLQVYYLFTFFYSKWVFSKGSNFSVRIFQILVQCSDAQIRNHFVLVNDSYNGYISSS